MTAEENKAIVRRFFEECFNQGNLAIADDLIAADYTNHMLDPDSPHGPKGEKAAVSGNRAVFPDLQFTIEDMIAEGDRVVARLTQRGTQQGEVNTPLGRIPPNDKHIAIDAIMIFRVAGGKLTESWGVFDALSAMEQAGAILAPKMAGEG